MIETVAVRIPPADAWTHLPGFSGTFFICACRGLYEKCFWMRSSVIRTTQNTHRELLGFLGVLLRDQVSHCGVWADRLDQFDPEPTLTVTAILRRILAASSSAWVARDRGPSLAGGCPVRS
jgi:hypothetical protein